MQISLTVSAVLQAVLQTAEENGEAAINPWFVGGGALLILLLALGALVAFGGGRDHS